MGKKLVIVESPAKAKTINKIVGKDYIVKSSMGHVRDLPVRNMGVEIGNGFKPKYVVVKGRKKVMEELKKAAKDAECVYLAPDPDREGEAIAWHLKEVLKVGNDKPFYRIQYNEITPTAVRKAFSTPGEIEMKRVDAQQARRILDRIVGYMVSPVLWRRIQRGLSAGRVQSVALRLVCERENEIRNFVPEEYWLIGARVRKQAEPLDPFRIKLVKIDGEKAEVKTGDQAAIIRRELETSALKVGEISVREVNKRPGPPYITSTLQQAASSYCGLEPSRTMRIAQELYEGVDLGEGPVGLITYMRTDSFSVAAEAIEACRGLVAETFGKEYLPEKPNFFRSRASAQEAHEAIRPTDVRRTPESLAGRMEPILLKLYTMIWQRFVSSQMAPAVIEQTTVKVDAVPRAPASHSYTFHANASQVTFAGYMKVSGADQQEKTNGEDADESDRLPPLREGEPLDCLEWLADRKETQPPPRFTEASLVKALEENGVGRPSTYAAILSTLHQRQYVIRQKRTLFPTELGFQVNTLLVTNLGELFNVEFTASMEASLDQIEEGTVNWVAMLTEFYGRFQGWMEKVKEPSADREAVVKLLVVFDRVTEWSPEVKRGKRTYNDRKFVESIKKQVDEGQKAVTARQLDALIRIARHYKGQIPDIDSLLPKEDQSNIANQPPAESTLKKLEILSALPLEESAAKFIESLSGRAKSGRGLTDRQVSALNRIVVSRSNLIENFEARKAELGLDHHSEMPADNESGALLKEMESVTEWHPPTTRGDKTFNDKEFYQSLSTQFQRKGFLSPRQRFALKKMVRKYQRPKEAAEGDRAEVISDQ